MCSVSLFDEETLVSFKELDQGYTHAENLHVFADALIKEAHIPLQHLSAIAVSKGPGSYTGLRIGVSAAKGLAFAHNIPLIAVDTLQLMCKAVEQTLGVQTHYCPMIDARRMEVYCCVYDSELRPLEPIEALIVDKESTKKFYNYKGLCFFGDGMPKSKDLLLSAGEFSFIPNICPSAKHMGKLSYAKFRGKDFENTAYFEPYYLKDFLAGKKKLKDEVK